MCNNTSYVATSASLPANNTHSTGTWIFPLLHRYTTYSSWPNGLASLQIQRSIWQQVSDLVISKKTSRQRNLSNFITLKKNIIISNTLPKKKTKFILAKQNKSQVWWLQWPKCGGSNPGHGGQKPEAIEVHRIASLGVRAAPRRMEISWYFLRAQGKSEIFSNIDEPSPSHVLSWCKICCESYNTKFSLTLFPAKHIEVLFLPALHTSMANKSAINEPHWKALGWRLKKPIFVWFLGWQRIMTSNSKMHICCILEIFPSKGEVHPTFQM